jgi:hypothetical protein
MNDNTIESVKWHKDQLSKLLSDEIDFHKVESELDSILEKAKTKKKVLVRRGGKIHRAYRWVGSDDNPDIKRVKNLLLRINDQKAVGEIEIMEPDDVLPILEAGLKAYETEEPDGEIRTPGDQDVMRNSISNIKHLIKYLGNISYEDRVKSRETTVRTERMSGHKATRIKNLPG